MIDRAKIVYRLPTCTSVMITFSQDFVTYSVVSKSIMCFLEPYLNAILHGTYCTNRGTQRLFSVKYLREKQKLPRIFYSLRKAKTFWMTSTVHSCTIFDAHLIIKIAYDFLKFNLSYLTPQVKLFFVEPKEAWNFRNQKCDRERN